MTYREPGHRPSSKLDERDLSTGWPTLSNTSGLTEWSFFGQWTDMDVFRTSTRSLLPPSSRPQRDGHVRTIRDLAANCLLSHSYRSVAALR
jgi:hypothetical protein